MSAFVHHAVAIATEIQRFFVHFALTFRHRITGGNRAKTERRTNKGLFRSPKRSQNDTGHPWAMLIEIIRGEAFLDTLLVLFLSTIFWLIWSLKMARRRRAVLS